MNSLRILAKAALLGLIAGLCGCGGSCSVGLASGRTVSAKSDTATVSATGGADTSTVTLGNSKVVVEPKRVVMDGFEVAHIRPNVRSVEIERKRDRLTIVADGQAVVDAVVR
jgi:hypothetical protein